MITDDDVRALMFEASKAGDDVQMILCRLALGADAHAILEGGYFPADMDRAAGLARTRS